MRVAVFGTKSYDREFLQAANDRQGGLHELAFIEPRLTATTVRLAESFPAVCVFVNDTVDRSALQKLSTGGTRLIALRCAGFNQVDLQAAREVGIKVVRVPAYSPYAVAEHTVGMMLALNRKLHRAHARTREGNFSLDGLLGFDMHGRTASIIGTGKIGEAVARILHGFGCTLLAYDVQPSPVCQEIEVKYLPLEEALAQGDIISLHCPLTPQTKHMIDARAVERMKGGVMLINTSRGALIDTRAAIAGLKSGTIGYLGLDVYEEEAELFFEDQSQRGIADDIFARLLTFPNVLITGHQAFFTREALSRIAETTIANITDFSEGRTCANEVSG